MTVTEAKIPICPDVVAFYIARDDMMVINLSAKPNAKIIRVDFMR